MDNIKIGNFIKELRLGKGWSQEELASKLYISRQSVSKWENGQTAPSMSIMIKLAEIFDVTVTEVMTGEKATTKKTKEITSTTSNEMIKMHKETKKVRKISFVIIFVLLFAFLGYYFFSSYRSQQIYSISGESENYTIDGLLIITKSKSYLSIQNIKPNENIDEITLYYIDKNENRHELYKTEDDTNIFVKDYMGYDEIFDLKDVINKFDNIYAEIKNKKTSEDIKLNFRKIYENDELIKLDKTNIGTNTEANHEIDNERLVEAIKTKFKNNDPFYEYSVKEKNKEITMQYNAIMNILNIIVYEEKTRTTWTYDITTNILQYDQSNTSNNEIIEQYQENIKSNKQFVNEFLNILKNFNLDSN